MRRYSEAVKADVRRRMRPPHRQSVAQISAELGISRPRISNDNPYSESLFRTVKYRPDYLRKPFASKEQACAWIAAFVDWYNYLESHSGIKFVTP